LLSVLAKAPEFKQPQQTSTTRSTMEYGRYNSPYVHESNRKRRKRRSRRRRTSIYYYDIHNTITTTTKFHQGTGNYFPNPIA
jgi:hypothetical protein